jgi:hypothetical protein
MSASTGLGERTSVTFTTGPLAPVLVSASSTLTTASVSWAAAPGAPLPSGGWRVYVNGSRVVPDRPVGTLSYQVLPAATPATLYAIEVCGVVAAGEGSGQCATRGPKWSRCMHTKVWLLERHV